MKTWREQAQALAEAGVSPEAIESARRIGARARHEARVRDAAEHLLVLCPAEPMPALVRDAIQVALVAVGAPGSVCGTSPPSLLPGGPSADARVAAYHQALAARAITYAPQVAEVVHVGDHVSVTIAGRTWRNIDGAAEGVLCEHVLARICHEQGYALARWAEHCVGPCPPHDPRAHAAHAYLVRRRREAATER